VPSIFFFKTLCVKLSGSVGAVAGGLAVGKEGPFVHAGACLGALLSQGGSNTRHLPWFKRFWNDRDRADFVACGTAAGEYPGAVVAEGLKGLLQGCITSMHRSAVSKHQLISSKKWR